jgi:thiol:disulfide interchange protein
VGRLAMPSEAVPEKVSFVRAILALLFVATSVWLSTGLFGRSLGELESFLPPSASPVIPQATSSNTTQLDWILNDYGGALRQARLLNKPLFIDFTGYTCTNCRWMEANMFTRPEVHSALQKFVLARLYTDGDGAVFDSQQKMERERFGTVALPFYAIISASDQALATFPGLTRNPNEFQKFLSTDRAATTSQN